MCRAIIATLGVDVVPRPTPTLIITSQNKSRRELTRDIGIPVAASLARPPLLPPGRGMGRPLLCRAILGAGRPPALGTQPPQGDACYRAREKETQETDESGGTGPRQTWTLSCLQEEIILLSLYSILRA